MCGRYATSTSTASLSELFDASDELDAELAPDYNVAPTDAAPIVRVRAATGERVLSSGRWGFLPSWAKDPRSAARMINARAETVASSRVFAEPFARRRCLVPVDGWYEWLRLGRGGRKQAYFMTRRDGEPMGLAGIWGTWRCGDERRLTYSIVTTAAVGDLQMVHDRMPLMLPRKAWAEWLDSGCGPDAGFAAAETTRGGERSGGERSGGESSGRRVRPDIVELLTPPSTKFVSELEIRPVGPAVGDVRNRGRELVERVPAAPLNALVNGGADSALF